MPNRCHDPLDLAFFHRKAIEIIPSEAVDGVADFLGSESVLGVHHLAVGVAADDDPCTARKVGEPDLEFLEVVDGFVGG